jgi:hypothetical protein
MRVVTTVRKRGRRVSLIDVELQQGVRTGDAPDALFAVLCGDVSVPVTFGVNRMGWAPTVQIGQDWFDEDHIVVDCEGRIIVQTRQLAMVPPAE